MQVAHFEFISHVFLQTAPINGVTAVIVLVLSVDNLLKSIPLCGRSRVIFRFLCLKMWVWTVPSDDEHADFDD